MENAQRFSAFVLVVMVSALIIPLLLIAAVSITSNRSFYIPIVAFMFGITLISLMDLKNILNVVLISVALICFQLCFIELFIIYIKSMLAKNELQGNENFEIECVMMVEYAVFIHSNYIIM